MLIRAAPQVCLVVLPSGLTLELCYDHLEDGPPIATGERARRDAGGRRAGSRSQGVWLFHHEVLLEAKVGQA
jgi:hypothetical protein